MDASLLPEGVKLTKLSRAMELKTAYGALLVNLTVDVDAFPGADRYAVEKLIDEEFARVAERAIEERRKAVAEALKRAIDAIAPAS